MNRIEKGLVLESTPDLGLLHHMSFGHIIAWRQHEFHTWWNVFESTMKHPLSRSFINAVVDSLEINHPLSSSRGFFWKKKFASEVNILTNTLGWGLVEIEQRRVVQGAHPLLSVAFGQFVIESYDQLRYKVRWVEPRAQTVQLELEATTDLPPPQIHNSFPWSSQSTGQTYQRSELKIHQNDNCELRVEGERIVLIPIQTMERFLTVCQPYAPETKEDWFSHSIEPISNNENIFKIIVKSIAAMFLKTEQPVYIIDQSSWDAYMDNYLAERGWGRVDILGYNTSSFELKFGINMGPHLPFTLGMVCGIWERAHGRAYRVDIQQESDIFLVKIESFLEYQNH